MAQLSELLRGADAADACASSTEATQSANSFPQSFPVLHRNCSNASSIFTDISEMPAASLVAEQQESLHSISESAEPKAAETAEGYSEHQKLDRLSPSAAPEANSSAVAKTLEAAAPSLAEGHLKPNGAIPKSDHQIDIKETQPQKPEEPAFKDLPAHASATASQDSSSTDISDDSIPEPAGESATRAETAPDLSTKAGCGKSPLPNGSAAGAAPPGPDLLSEQLDGGLALEDSGRKRSGSSLSAESDPYIPTKPQQSTPRHNGSQSNGTSTPGSLNANAVTFVPSQNGGPPPGEAAWQPPQLKFGTLPEGLAEQLPGSCHLEQREYGYDVQSQDGFHYSGSFPEAWNGEYEYEQPYMDGAYMEGDGCHYYQQPDGSWMHYWGHPGDHAPQENWVGYGGNHGYEPFGGERAENGGSRQGRPGKRRGQERRKEGKTAWQSAVLDILEANFSYSRECLHEMLELHDGNLEVALDMLAQLEAEMAGQLPASGQDAPELNEENFPSLSGSAAASPLPQSKNGFAEAVKSPVSTLAHPSPARSQHSGSSLGNGAATPKQPGSPVPWKETGAAVSEFYARKRAVARDHARLRNTYFQEATKAYLSGNKALAKSLSGKGREQSDLMKAAHAEASQAIYKHRNPASGGRGRAPGLIDLHGLHSGEAVAFLEDEIEAARRSRPKAARGPQRLCILVGLGNHTKGSKTPARLPAAVEDWLRASQIAYHTASPGLLEISI